MSILVNNKEIEASLERYAERQPVRTSKTALAEAILRKAAAMDPVGLRRWLEQSPAPAAACE